jgi:hypothetical protein
MSVAVQLIRDRLAHALRVEHSSGDHARRRSERELDRVDSVEQVLLVLLQILVVREGERVDHPMQRRQISYDARCLAAQQLGCVGVLLLGHDRGA